MKISDEQKLACLLLLTGLAIIGGLVDKDSNPDLFKIIEKKKDKDKKQNSLKEILNDS